MATFDMGNTVALKTWANDNGIDAKRARRFARTGKLPAAFQIGATKSWLIDSTTDVPAELSAPATRGRSTRTDGRVRWVVHATPTEIAAMHDAAPDAAITDPRVVSKQRRDAKRDIAAMVALATEHMDELTEMVNSDARNAAIADTKPDGAI